MAIFAIYAALLTLTSSHDQPPNSKSVQRALNQMLNDDNDCMASWPNVTHCLNWWIDPDDNLRYALTNSIPPYPVKPYCPFGIGKGYCMTGENHDSCSQFKGMECPAQPGAPPTGDVPVAQLVLYGVPLNPDPTNPKAPQYVYHENPVIWYYWPTNNSLARYPNAYNMLNAHGNGRKLLQGPPPGPGGGTIGVHIAGQNIKGPEEAEGVNIDMSGIPLICGGHVTPPLGLGPQYHYHKASTCLMDDMADIRYHIRDNSSSHSDLVAYANDGFGIYGFYDLNGKKPVMDQCNGHLGCLDDECKIVEYHYHAQNFTYSGSPTEQFQPYWIGCLGPSKGICNSTIPPQDNTPKCGPGCGYQICVQPGTNNGSLNEYIDSFGKANWLSQWTVNPY
eukprot:61557_1